MKIRKRVAFGVSAMLLVPSICFADSAEVLPKGVRHFDLVYYHYLDITENFDQDGNNKPLAGFLNMNLDSGVFGPAVGPLSAGRSVVDFTHQYRNFEMSFNYGLTEKLSIGTKIFYSFFKNKVNARVDSSGATLVKNESCFGSPDPTCAAVATLPFVDAGTGAALTRAGYPTEAIGNEDLQSFLGDGMVVNGITIPGTGLGFDRIDTWSGSDIGDIELAARYQFYNQAPWRFAVTGGTRLPTGEEDNIDSFVDIPTGGGQTDLFVKFHADYTGIDKLFLSSTLGYNLQLPGDEIVRVPVVPGAGILGSVKEQVDMDRGDGVGLELIASYALSKTFSMGMKYEFDKKFSDSCSGSLGYAYSDLENNSDSTSHRAQVFFGFSTVQMYMDKEFPLPIYGSIAYRDRFAGENANDSRYISGNIGILF